MPRERVDLGEGPLVQQRINPAAGRALTAFTLFGGCGSGGGVDALRDAGVEIGQLGGRRGLRRRHTHTGEATVRPLVIPAGLAA